MFSIFEDYHRAVFEELQVFDSDDIALSLLSTFRTALWEMKRKKLGYDFLFVDETQLFNENERRLFPLLTRDNSRYVPIVLALDEAQQSKTMSQSGLGLLGIESVVNEQLSLVHRSSKQIIELAFFVIQKTTDLFGPDFPNFTGDSFSVIASDDRLVAPQLVHGSSDTTLGKTVLRQVRQLRKANIWQIAVVCHAERYWKEIQRTLSDSDLPLLVLEQRGERLSTKRPLVVLTRPQTVGGQEFDAVIAVGLEQGVVPPKVIGNEALESALEQQALREMYLSFTRAKYRLIVVNTYGSAPTSVLQEARQRGLIAVHGSAE